MMTQEDMALYCELTEAAESKATGSQVAAITVRAYGAGWETGDIHEALSEGGYSLSFGTIEALGQRYAMTGSEAS